MPVCSVSAIPRQRRPQRPGLIDHATGDWLDRIHSTPHEAPDAPPGALRDMVQSAWPELLLVIAIMAAVIGTLASLGGGQ